MYRLSQKLDKTIAKIESRYPSLFQLNIPKIESEYIFTRFELHNFYTKYKALVHLSVYDSEEFKNYGSVIFFKKINIICKNLLDLLDVDKGIDINSFKKGLSENFESAHEELIKKMFSLNNNSSY